MKRLLVIVVVLILAGIAGLGIWMVTRTETEEDRVVQSFEALKGAVETRDPALLVRYLHMDYTGWGGDRTSAVELFARAIESYSNARIEVREQTVRINPTGDEATMEFEWSYRATLQSDVRTVTREQMDMLPSGTLPWEKARAVFRKDANGRWALHWIETKIPRF